MRLDFAKTKCTLDRNTRNTACAFRRFSDWLASSSRRRARAREHRAHLGARLAPHFVLTYVIRTKSSVKCASRFGRIQIKGALGADLAKSWCGFEASEISAYGVKATFNEHVKVGHVVGLVEY